MYILVLIIHVIVCFVLILVVLLQAGRGGGFSDMMGGGQPQSIFGTQSNAFMARATEVCAVLFVITSLTLGMMSTQKGKSLMQNEMLKKSLMPAVPAASVTPPAAPATPSTPPAAAPVPSTTGTTAKGNAS